MSLISKTLSLDFQGIIDKYSVDMLIMLLLTDQLDSVLIIYYSFLYCRHGDTSKPQSTQGSIFVYCSLLCVYSTVLMFFYKFCNVCFLIIENTSQTLH